MRLRLNPPQGNSYRTDFKICWDYPKKKIQHQNKAQKKKKKKKLSSSTTTFKFRKFIKKLVQLLANKTAHRTFSEDNKNSVPNLTGP